MSYYKKFGLVLGNPLWPHYLKWAYAKCLEDVESLGLIPDLTKKDFTALLCGCGNEQTADTFIQFILKRNRKPKIIIIDLGKEQIEVVKKFVNQKYPNLNISVYQANALALTETISPGSIDWIETDALIEYFDHQSLKKLLSVWGKILANDGFITTRDFITKGFFTKVVDYFRINLGKLWLNVTLFPHTGAELSELYSQAGFKFVTGKTFVYTFNRISLVKKR